MRALSVSASAELRPMSLHNQMRTATGPPADPLPPLIKQNKMTLIVYQYHPLPWDVARCKLPREMSFSVLSTWRERGKLPSPSAHAPGKRAPLLFLLTLPFPDTFSRRCGPRSSCRDSPARPPASSPPSDRPPTSRRRHPTPRRPTQRQRRPTLASKPSTQTTRRDSVRFTSVSAAVSRIGAGVGGAWEARGRRSCSSDRRAARREQEGPARSSGRGRDTEWRSCCPFSQSSCPLAGLTMVFPGCLAILRRRPLWVLGAVLVVLEASSATRSPTAAQTLTPCLPSRSVSKSEASFPPSRRPTM